MRIWPGSPYPAGATFDGAGVNFAIFSEHATKVELCLFDGPESKKETHRISLPEHTDMMWHGYLPDVEPGQLYGYRIHGPYDPAKGHRFNHNKVVLDPYAKAIGRNVIWDDSLYGYTYGQADTTFDPRDNGAFCPLALVVDTAFTWGDDRPPRVPWHKTLIYEAHVKGLTMRHPGVPDDRRGTYAGVATEPIIEHLLSLNVTAIELLPVHFHLDSRRLQNLGLTNYWGYDTLNYFAPHIEYASRQSPQRAISDFKMMVRTLHAAGIEVILDVVYNHTCEGDQLGPTLSWRGIDNATYYRLDHGDKSKYIDFTGTGNTLNMTNPRVLQMMMDSLRYWVTEMHVDGFRFDLASALARELHDVNRLGVFFDTIHQDPIISTVKLIAEPWDVGPGGSQVGNFPVLWTEWNGKYRDSVRRFWKGDGGQAGEIAQRVAGSSDLYEANGRKPYASINFVTAHDGFTMRDLVSYDHKHNDANGEENRDGTDENYSWNCGAEGPTDDGGVKALRARQMKNLFATLLFSQGVPMIFGGDELSHTKHGNNNTYCQDNELTWLNWDVAEDPDKEAFLEFARLCTTIWAEQPVLQRRKFFIGRPIRGEGVKDISFFTPFGDEMDDAAFNSGFVQCIGVRYAGDLIHEVDPFGRPIKGDTLLLLFNAHWQELPFTLPPTTDGQVWQTLVDTADSNRPAGPRVHDAGEAYPLYGRSFALLRTIDPDEVAATATMTEAQLEAIHRRERERLAQRGQHGTRRQTHWGSR